MQIINIICLAVIEIAGDFALEKYANTNNIYALISGLIGYTGVVYFLVESLRGSTVLYVNGMWDGLSTLVESLAAFYILGERFEKWEQYLGLFFTILGVVLLKRGRTYRRTQHSVSPTTLYKLQDFLLK